MALLPKAHISSTSAPHYVLTRAKLEPLLAARGPRPLLLVDIAVPRDCEPEINKIDGAYLYDIDDLQEIVEGNRGARERDAEEAHRRAQRGGWDKHDG